MAQEFEHADAFNTIKDGVFVFKPNGEPAFINQAAAKILGAPSATDLMHKLEYYFERVRLYDTNDEILPISQWPVDRVFRGESLQDLKLRAHRQDINFHAYLSVDAQLINQLSTGIRLAVIIFRDITAQTKLEEELKTAKTEAESTAHSKSVFLAKISHEIRTPLGAILGFTELMRESDSEKERTEFAEVIQRNGFALTKIIDDILDLSKIEAGHIELEAVSFNVLSLIQEVVTLFAETARRKNIAITIDVDRNIASNIKSDATRIRQILINLVDNAVKFTSKGSVKIKVEPLFEKEILTHIQFVVEDTGQGLTTKQTANLFDPFAPGLGLILSRRLARALGGDVFLSYTRFGLGSTFTANVTASDSDAKSPYDQLVTRGPHTQNLKDLQILLVEDAIDNQDLVKLILTKQGASVEVANNGEEGIQKTTEKEFDIILMDMQMPVLDGYAATERLRQNGYKKPILALTAHASPDEKKRSAQVGCDAHLTKPLDFSLLIRTLKHFTQRH